MLYPLGIVLIFYVLSLANALILSKAPKVAFDILAVEMVGVTFLFFLPFCIQTSSDYKKIFWAFCFSAVFAYILNSYMLLTWVTTGEYIKSVPFWNLYETSDYFSRGSTFLGFPRFRLPMSTTGSTGPFLALCGIILFNMYFAVKNKKAVLALFIINTFFLIGTFSRAGWIILFVGVVVSMYQLRKTKLLNINKFAFASIICLVLLLGLLFAVPEMGQLFLQRFSLETTAASNLGHLQTRLLGLQKFSEAPLVGIGIGNLSAQGFGVHTHSIYTSYLAERGIIITLIFVSFLFLITIQTRRKIRSFLRLNQKYEAIIGISLYSGLVALIVGHVFYEIRADFVWLFYALALMYINMKVFPLTYDLELQHRGLGRHEIARGSVS